MKLWEDKCIFNNLTRREGSPYRIRDHMRRKIGKIEDDQEREFFRAIRNRLLYETQWEEWQLLQYKYLFEMTDRNAQDIWITTGFPTATAIALGYYWNPNLTVVFKELPYVTPCSQSVAWNTWGIKIIERDFRKIEYSKSDLWLNTILSDMALWDDLEVYHNATKNPLEVTFDLEVFSKLPSGQECAWAWPFGGSRLTFGLLFDYPDDYWHSPKKLIERWSRVMDISDFHVMKLPKNESLELNMSDVNYRHVVKHQETTTLFVRGKRR